MLGYFVIGFLCLVVLSASALVVSFVFKLIRKILSRE